MKKIFNILIVLILTLTICLTYSFNVNAIVVEGQHSDVLTDLKLDTSFDLTDYPKVKSDEDDEDVQVIQLGESVDNELFIYTYQPRQSDSSSITFNCIYISLSFEYTETGEGLDPIIYELEFISSYDDYLYKYKVSNYSVTSDEYRYYNIVSIYRPYIDGYDEELDNGSETEDYKIAIKVAQQWRVYYLNDVLYYEMGTFDVVEIEVNYSGYIFGDSGFKFKNLFGDYDASYLWFVAFDLENYKAERIIEATLSYQAVGVFKYINQYTSLTGYDETIRYTYYDWDEYIENKTGQTMSSSSEEVFSDFIYVYLSEEDTITYNGGGLFAKTYSWNAILSGDDFVDEVTEQDGTIYDDAEEKINNSQWVFTFAQTPYKKNFTYDNTSYTYTSYKYYYYYYDVTKVTILRLKFFNEGKTYDLGVVSDMVNPDNESDGYLSGTLSIEDIWERIKDLFKKIIKIVLFILLFVILVTVFPPIFSVIKLVVGIVLNVISIPFKIIKKLFKKNKKT